VRDPRIERLAQNRDGTRKYRCPECSAQRKKKTDTPLSITRRGTEVVWYCHHCEFTGGYDEARREDHSMGYQTENQRRNPARNERWRRTHTVW
jgi:ribosomal protein L37AE/L43A